NIPVGMPVAMREPKLKTDEYNNMNAKFIMQTFFQKYDRNKKTSNSSASTKFPSERIPSQAQ
ncbi:hypothetical protein D6833_02015, partial [Candidatus Parcubacteria bacterium]